MLGKDVKVKQGYVYRVTKGGSLFEMFETNYLLQILEDFEYNQYNGLYIGVIFNTKDGRHIVEDWDYELLCHKNELSQEFPEYCL